MFILDYIFLHKHNFIVKMLRRYGYKYSITTFTQEQVQVHVCLQNYLIMLLNVSENFKA